EEFTGVRSISFHYFSLVAAAFFRAARRARSFARRAVAFRLAIEARAFSPFRWDIPESPWRHGNTFDRTSMDHETIHFCEPSRSRIGQTRTGEKRAQHGHRSPS